MNLLDENPFFTCFGFSIILLRVMKIVKTILFDVYGFELLYTKYFFFSFCSKQENGRGKFIVSYNGLICK